MPNNTDLKIRPANTDDCMVILSFIKELAEYEKMSSLVVATDNDIHKALFGEPKYADCLIAEWQGLPVGFALYFFIFSTFEGKPALYLEDLYVQPGVRGNGIGKSLLQRLASTALQHNCSRMDWAVLDWNQPAIEFYQSIGAHAEDQWTTFRLDGEELLNFGKNK
ncbi:MAG: GNAT family N-acetyltransferase [Proteobacteria bacterium]|nr:GNAT family N-acetyltransferase [Pseudomonadota bacterium]